MLSKTSMALLAICILGQSGLLNAPTFNYFKDFIKPIAIDSFERHFGVDDSMNAASRTWIWSLIGSLDQLGSLLADPIVWWLLDAVGPRTMTLVVKTALNIFASLLLFLTGPLRSIECLMLSRLLGGICSTFAKADAIYVAGAFAPAYRGRAALLLNFTGAMWKIAATILAMEAFFGTATMWPYYTLIPVLPSVVMMISAVYFPPTSQWLLITKGRVDEAKRSISFYNPHLVVNDVLTELDAERELGDNRETIDFRSAMSLKELRVPFLTVLIIAFAGAINGDKIADQYSRAMLEMHGVSDGDSLKLLFCFQLTSAVLSFFSSLYLVERLGRRQLVIVICSVYVTSLSSLVLSSFLGESQTTLGVFFGIFGLFLMIASQGTGLGSLCRLYISEMCPMIIRGKALSASFLLADIVGLVQVSVWPSLNRAIGAWSFVPLLVGELFCLYWLCRHLPETKGKTVTEIIAEMLQRRESQMDLSSIDKLPAEYRRRSMSISVADAVALSTAK